MSLHEFEFDLHVDAGERPGALGDAVAAEVARQLGYDAAVASRIVGELNVAIAEICRKGDACRVHFRAAAGELEVVVAGGSHAQRRFLHRIP